MNIFKSIWQTYNRVKSLVNFEFKYFCVDVRIQVHISFLFPHLSSLEAFNIYSLHIEIENACSVTKNSSQVEFQNEHEIHNGKVMVRFFFIAFAWNNEEEKVMQLEKHYVMPYDRYHWTPNIYVVHWYSIWLLPAYHIKCHSGEPHPKIYVFTVLSECRNKIMYLNRQWVGLTEFVGCVGVHHIRLEFPYFLSYIWNVFEKWKISFFCPLHMLFRIPLILFTVSKNLKIK